MYANLRRESAERTVELDFPGYAIGGLSLDRNLELMSSPIDVVRAWAVRFCLDSKLPAEQPFSRLMRFATCPCPTIRALRLYPNLGDALNTNQIGAAERTHRAGDVFSTCQARVDRSGCGEPRRDHRRSGPYARTHRPAPAENPRKRRPRRAPGSPSRERCRACSAPPL